MDPSQMEKHRRPKELSWERVRTWRLTQECSLRPNATRSLSTLNSIPRNNLSSCRPHLHRSCEPSSSKSRGCRRLHVAVVPPRSLRPPARGTAPLHQLRESLLCFQTTSLSSGRSLRRLPLCGNLGPLRAPRALHLPNEPPQTSSDSPNCRLVEIRSKRRSRPSETAKGKVEPTRTDYIR